MSVDPQHFLRELFATPGEPPARERRPAPAYDPMEDDIPFCRVDMNADPAFVKASARVRRVA